MIRVIQSMFLITMGLIKKSITEIFKDWKLNNVLQNTLSQRNQKGNDKYFELNKNEVMYQKQYLGRNL